MSTTCRARPARCLIPALTVIASVAFAPSSATPQLPIKLRLGTFAGVADARGDLPNAPILSSRTNVVSYGGLSSTSAVGVSLEGRTQTLPVSVRLSITRTLAGDELGVWGCAPDADGQPTPCPSILIEIPTGVATTIGTVDAIVDVPLGRITLRPLAGLSWWRQRYSWDPAPVGSFSLDPGRYTDDTLALHLGVGVGVPVGGVVLVAEAGAYGARSTPARPSRMGSLTLGVTAPLN